MQGMHWIPFLESLSISTMPLGEKYEANLIDMNKS